MIRPTLRQIEGPASEPDTLESAKRYLRVTVDADDAIITAAIASAREQFELATSRQVITAKWEAYWPWFPGWIDAPYDGLHYESRYRSRLKLPRPPLQRVESVEYRNDAGEYETFPAAKYVTMAPAELRASVGWIEPAPDEVWPDTRVRPDAVKVTYVAGYDPGSVPPMILSTIRALMGSEYENRKAEGTSAGAVPNPAIKRALMDLEVKLGS